MRDGSHGFGSTLVSLLLCLESVFAVIGGAVFLSQVMTPLEYAGCILMFVAAVVSQIPFKQKQE